MSSVGDFPGVDFVGTALKFRKRKKIRRRLFTSSIKLAFRHFHADVTTKKCTKKPHARELNKPIAFLTISLLSPSSLLKLPQKMGKT